MVCRNCGKELKEGAIVCGYCGFSIPETDLDSSAKNKMAAEQRSDESLKKDGCMSIRILGIALMVISGIADIASMFLITSGSFEVFNGLTIGSTIAFFIGLIMTFAFR
ncbi:MAG: zinc ribbon domain-containing protein [Clostridia bacterium]|nr:zinc ribbon domain-containing protein [Clostridia bacterium]